MTPLSRLLWLDIAKGIGIILVVVGHVLLRSEAPGAASIAAFIYLFHMPLFFILAGMILKPEPLPFYAVRKAIALLLPYGIFLCLLGIPAMIASCGLGIPIPDLGIDRCPVLPLKLVAGGSLLGGIFGAFWFIPCLLGALVLAQFVLSLAGNSHARLLLVGGLLTLVAYALPALLPQSTAILSLGIMPMAALFVLVGYTLRTRLPLLGGSTLLVSAAIAALTTAIATAFDMKSGRYGIPALGAAGAVALSCLLLRLSSSIAGLRLGRLLAALGKHSLTILYLHQAVHLGLRHLGFNNDSALIALSLLLPVLLHAPLGRLIFAIATAPNAYLFRKSSKALPPLP